jgi:FkbM family methyltransferase
MPGLTELRHKVVKGFRVGRNPAFWRALRHGVAASIEHDDVPLPRGLKTILDVGANRGQFMVYASHRFPLAAIECFEPIPAARAKLEVVRPPGRTINVRSVALASTNGRADFHIAAADDSSSLYSASDTQLEMFPSSRERAVIDVETARLDDVLGPDAVSRPSLLKIDVQGGELDVLLGAERTLKQIDYVLAECSFVELYAGQPLGEEVVRFLEAHGFGFVGFYSETVSAGGETIQADGLFRRDR